MSRIVPPVKAIPKSEIPKWMDVNKVNKIGKTFQNKVRGLVKQATKEELIISSYLCSQCHKVYQAGSKLLEKQILASKKANVECKLTCSDCGSDLIVHSTVPNISHSSNLQTLNTEVRVDLKKEAASHGTYNTFIDRTIHYKVIQKLADYARDKGMTAAVVGYLRGEHVKESSSDTSMLNNIECKIEWMYGRKQKGFATAMVKIDEAGKIEFPRVFKVQSGMEYPFEEKYIRRLEREPVMFQQSPNRKKTDIPTYRPHDPTQFRVASKKGMRVKDFKKISSNILDSEKEKIMNFIQNNYLFTDNAELKEDLIKEFNLDNITASEYLTNFTKSLNLNASIKVRDYKKSE